MASNRRKASGKPAGNVGGNAPRSTAKAVDVLAEDGSVIRTYSEKEHGKDFRKLAEEFVGKKSNSGVKIVAA